MTSAPVDPRAAKPAGQTALPAATYIRRLQHSFAYLVRKRDAQVRLRWSPMLREFVYNFFGHLALPVMLCRHGAIGAYNRLYLGIGQRNFSIQFINVFVFFAVNIAFILCHGEPGFDLSFFELASMNILNLLRCATIAVKYATFAPAELRELDCSRLSEAERNEQLVIVGWASPPTRLLFSEMERAITRTCPHLNKHAVVFPDLATRDAMLCQMQECLPSFNAFEFALDAPKNAVAGDSTLPVGADPVHEFLKHVDQQVAVSVDTSSAAAKTASDEHSPPRPLQVGSSLRRPPSLARRHSTSHGLPAEAVQTSAGSIMVQPFVKAHVPIPSLPSIPAKLLLWHVIYQTHHKPSVSQYFVPAVMATLVFAALPFVIRSIMGRWPSMSGFSIAVLGLMAEQNVFLLFTTMSFVIVGVIDLSRRLKASKMLFRMLDYNALIALQLHDAGELPESSRTQGAIFADEWASPRISKTLPCSFSIEQVTQVEDEDVVAPSARRYRKPRSGEHDCASCGQRGGDVQPSLASSIRAFPTQYREEFQHMDLHPAQDDDSFASLLRHAISPHGCASRATTTSESECIITVQTGATPVAHQHASVPLAGNTPAKVRSGTCAVTNAGPPKAQHASIRIPNLDERTQQTSAATRRGRLPPVALGIQQRMLDRYMLLTPAEIERDILQPSSVHVSLPLLYPQNILAWSHLRNAVTDFGRNFSVRIMTFTAFFAAYVVAAVIFLLFMIAERTTGSAQIYVVIAVAGFQQVVFGSLLTMQVVQGARTNRMALAHQRRLNKVESLTYEYLATATMALPSVVRDRLLQTKKIAAAVVEDIGIEMQLAPARVMFIPANYGLLGTFASITLSGLLATYQGFRSME